MQPIPQEDHNVVVRKINATLRGAVIDTLSDLVPELRRLPKRAALEMVLDDIDLLHRCLLAFRTNPDRFRDILVNRHKVPVEHAEALLECGRSLDDVIAMVVRTAAKRHFRRRLDGALGRSPRLRPRRPTRPRNSGFLDRLFGLVGPAPHSRPREKSQGELLYEAFKDHLRHDWQIPMIPEYCLLSPTTVRRLGARILDYRIAEDIRRLRADPDNPPPPTPLVNADQVLAAGYLLPVPDPALPAAITSGEDLEHDIDMSVEPNFAPANEDRDERARIDQILAADGRHLRPEAFATVLLDPQVRATLPHADDILRLAGTLGTVNGLAGRMLVGELGLRADQLVVFLASAHAALGDRRFELAFGLPGRPDYIARIVQRAKAFKIDQQTPLPEIAIFVAKSFTEQKS